MARLSIGASFVNGVYLLILVDICEVSKAQGHLHVHVCVWSHSYSSI